MASVLRHIVASNRAKHEETGLDLCYVTSNLLATCVLLFLGFMCLFITFFSLYPSFRLFFLSRLPHPLVTLVRNAAARPRVRDRETGLDFGYVTEDIIVTSGPSQTYPRLAYRNPLDKLVAFLDAKHGDNWAIWEFRAEGTGYPDEAVYNRIRHYPWPDHHPPPFALVPLIVASMRNWMNGGELLEVESTGRSKTLPAQGQELQKGGAKKTDRVVVVHCKAGKGRSGTMACSYLISECGWTAEDALARFTERRMRPGYGSGVSIPSQVRWVGYVDRWSKHGKKYVDFPIEIVEIHVWGLRHGVKLSVEGYEDEGKKIKVLHTFKHDERIVVEGDAPGGGGVMDLVTDMAGYVINKQKGGDEESAEITDYEEIAGGTGNQKKNDTSSSPERSSSKKSSRASSLLRKVSKRTPRGGSRSGADSGPSNTLLDGRGKAKTIAMPEQSPMSLSNPIAKISPGEQSQSTTSLQSASIAFADETEPGGQAVVFKPITPISIPNSDVNIVIERRNRVKATKMLTMVTSVAHVWFNAYFEGNGPEQDGRPDDSGVFEMEWDMLDGIKGSKQRGTRACDRLSVVWRVSGTEGAGVVDGEEIGDRETTGVTSAGPSGSAPVPQMKPANWKGGNNEDPMGEMHLGLRVADPESASISRASSVKSCGSGSGSGVGGDGNNGKDKGDNDGVLEGVKVSGPAGEDVLDDDGVVSSREKRDYEKEKEAIIES